MLNKNSERELAYVVTVDAIEPIPGKDRVECARVRGWTCMVPKGAFKVGDPGIYFEIDSLVPVDKDPFKFCEKYKGHIKTQKFKNPDGSQFWSQGLLMAAKDFGWTIDRIDELFITDDKMVRHIPGTESAFLTKQLGITYYEPEDQKRKASSSSDKYKKMAQRHPNLFKNNALIKWLYKRDWGKKLLFFFLGKKKDKRGWPEWVVKTDEERVQNIPFILQSDDPWIATEKIDGTSTTFTMKGRGHKCEFYVCSRNVCFDTPEKMEKGAWYDSNVYQEMAVKYNVEKVLSEIMELYKDLDFVTLQGETFGSGIQKRDYSMKDHDFRAFNLIFGYKNGERKRFNPREMTDILVQWDIPSVPIVDEHFITPKTVDEILQIATDKSMIDGGMREGLVFRSLDGVKSFKAVSNEFLVKYHQG